MAKFQNITSTLNSVGGGINSTLFPVSFGGTVNITVGNLICFYYAGPAAYTGVETSDNDLTDSYVVTEVGSVGDQTVVSWEAYPLQFSLDANNSIYFLVANNTVYCAKKVATVTTVLASFAYVILPNRYFRIREVEGTIYWDTSPDGIAWTNRATELVSNLFDMTAVALVISAGCFAAETVFETSLSINSINCTKKGRSRQFFPTLRPRVFSPCRAR